MVIVSLKNNQKNEKLGLAMSGMVLLGVPIQIYF
jgi:hypothetical protein